MRAGWIVVIGLVNGCSKPHVVLPAVTPNMTPEQRVQMFNELHATGEDTTTTSFCGPRACSTKTEKTLHLANGTQVYHPEDLLPIVGADSITARAVSSVHEHRRKALVYTGVGLASVVGLIAIGRIAIESHETSFSTPEKLGLVAIVAGLLVGGFGTWYHDHQATEYWGEANENYNTGLAQRLDVCTSGFAVVACESAPPPATRRVMPPMLGPTSAPAPASPGVTKPFGR